MVLTFLLLSLTDTFINVLRVRVELELCANVTVSVSDSHCLKIKSTKTREINSLKSSYWTYMCSTFVILLVHKRYLQFLICELLTLLPCDSLLKVTHAV